MNKINSSSFSAILQKGIDRENKRREKSRAANGISTEWIDIGLDGKLFKRG